MQVLGENSSVSNLKVDGFELWYQPVYGFADGSVSHNEVLLRWRDPKGNVLFPKQFMPWVSSAEQILWLDRLVTRKAVEELRRSPHASLSVNLSIESIGSARFIAYVEQLIARSGIHPQTLIFEISERQVAQKFHAALAFIRAVKAMGCSVVLDNFSNEYLTFLQWERLNVDVVKIDGHLLNRLNHEHRSLMLAKAITEVSNQMGQMAVAKSMDDLWSSRLLDQCPFDSGQGFQLKPPSQKQCWTAKVDILGVPIDNWSQAELLRDLESGIVFTPNVDHLMNIRKDPEFRKAYSIADYKLCDSQILLFTSHWLGNPLKEKISGSDFFPAFCDYHRQNPDITIFLLGGSEPVAEQAMRNLNQKAGRQLVVDACSPSIGFDENEQECQEIVARINRSQATVLAIGVGAPKQEKWVYRYRDQLTSVKIVFAVGAVLDFEAGTQKRAPQTISNAGGEWLFRLLQEPHRLWHRYLVNDLPFIWLIFKEKFNDL
jgi:exopolysaccharide biosynthesis WecB/TagA/CpsF family protein